MSVLELSLQIVLPDECISVLLLHGVWNDLESHRIPSIIVLGLENGTESSLSKLLKQCEHFSTLLIEYLSLRCI